MNKRPFSVQELDKFKELIKLNAWWFQVKFDDTIVIARTNELEKFDAIISLLEHYTNIVEITAYKNGDLNNRNASDKRFFLVNGIADGLGGLNTIQEQATNLFKKQLDEHKMAVLEKDNKEQDKYIKSLETELETLQMEKQQGALMFGSAGLLGGFINGFVKKSPQLLGLIPEQYKGLIGVENIEVEGAMPTQANALSEDDKWLLNAAKEMYAGFTQAEIDLIKNGLFPAFKADKSNLNICWYVIKNQPNTENESNPSSH